MGSEFAYEYIASQEVEKFIYTYLRDEAFDGHEFFVRENRPEYEYSVYTRQIEWMDKEIYQPRKVVYYDRKNELYKTLRFRGYKQYLSNYWRPSEMIMDNHQTGKRTIIRWNNYRFRTGLTDRDFNSPIKQAFFKDEHRPSNPCRNRLYSCNKGSGKGAKG